MTQSGFMLSRRWFAAFTASLAFSRAVFSQALDLPHPRLLLTSRRLKLLRRERERESLRWNQFHLLMAGKAHMPETGFAAALYYQAAGNAAFGRQAVEWALGPSADLRQVALVFDWCQDLLSESQRNALAAKISHSIEQSRRDASVSATRDRLFAALALSGHTPNIADREIDQVLHKWWEGDVVPALNSGREAIRLDDSYALLEILHAVRDNTNEDLRESAPHFFADLPMLHLLSYYPATYPAGENEFRIPATAKPSNEPDLRLAALARAAEFAMVAYDSNGPGSQILQGWLLNDNFMLRGVFGTPYEFLWANPYQPGLSYLQAPLVLHDDVFGRLFVRSSWEESAAWLGSFDGQLQLFQDGRISALDPHAGGEPLDMGRALIVFAAHTPRFKVSAQGDEPVFVLGLKPRQTYRIEVDDEELIEQQTDPGGILPLDVPHNTEAGVRMREAP